MTGPAAAPGAASRGRRELGAACVLTVLGGLVMLLAAGRSWGNVEPAIFGTLLENALDARERGRLGAQFTPRAFVERLVLPAVMEPLREDWDGVRCAAERAMEAGDAPAAAAFVRGFHAKLCTVRVLDPACGTGNFLYVALELMKRLEDEVLEALAALGGQEALSGLEGHTVDPHQFLGLEINPRAAAIAELNEAIQRGTERGSTPANPAGKPLPE